MNTRAKGVTRTETVLQLYIDFQRWIIDNEVLQAEIQFLERRGSDETLSATSRDAASTFLRVSPQTPSLIPSIYPQAHQQWHPKQAPHQRQIPRLIHQPNRPYPRQSGLSARRDSYD